MHYARHSADGLVLEVIQDRLNTGLEHLMHKTLAEQFIPCAPDVQPGYQKVGDTWVPPKAHEPGPPPRPLPTSIPTTEI
jgi:hypothetical protein